MGLCSCPGCPGRKLIENEGRHYCEDCGCYQDGIPASMAAEWRRMMAELPEENFLNGSKSDAFDMIDAAEQSKKSQK